ncbi:malate dehydrogenase [Pajaroellobacter abortibovis]|nr:malate dehydrogenase [Pajaroellobacter abortibovis]
MSGRKKIGIVGGGNIGGELARLFASRGMGDVWLLDIPAREKMVQGKALDLEQNAALLGDDVFVRGTSDWAEFKGADILIVTAGIPRKPGQSRDDLVLVNLPIIREIAQQARQHCPHAFTIVLSNPLDAMVYEYKRVTGFHRSQTLGMAGVLDSARFQLFLAREANVSVKDIRALVLGGHGDDMVPVVSACTIQGIPVTRFIPEERLSSIIERTRKGGGEIVGLMGTSAYYAPASAAFTMAASYLLDQKRVLCCAAYLEGEYGYRDLFMGVPVVIGKKGVEQIVTIPLTPQEEAMLAKSAKSVQSVLQVVQQSHS